MGYLKLVTKVDNNGVAHGGHINPLAILEELQTTDLVILEEQDEATGIGVSPETLDQLRVGTRRVVANLGAKSWSISSIEGLLEVPLFKSKILTEQVQELLC